MILLAYEFTSFSFYMIFMVASSNTDDDITRRSSESEHFSGIRRFKRKLNQNDAWVHLFNLVTDESRMRERMTWQE